MAKKVFLSIINILFLALIVVFIAWINNQREYIELVIRTNASDTDFIMHYDFGEGIDSEGGEVLKLQETGKYSLKLGTVESKRIERYQLIFDFKSEQKKCIVEDISLVGGITQKKTIDLRQLFIDTNLRNDLEIDILNMGEINVKGLGNNPYIFLDTLKGEIDNYISINNYRVETSLSILGIVLAGALLVVIFTYKKEHWKFHEFVFVAISSIGMVIYLRLYGKINYQEENLKIILCPLIIMVIYSIVYYGIQSKIPIRENNSNIFLRIKDLFKRESVIYIFLAGVTFFVCSYNLTVNSYFHNDEHYVMKAAEGFLQTGEFVLWDFVSEASVGSYTRAWPHTMLVALAFKLFGINLYAARMVSVVFGVFFILSLYYIVKRLFSCKNLAIISCMFMLVISEVIEVFRTVRMYSISMGLAVWLYYFAYRAITEKNTFKSSNRITKWIKKYFDYNLKYVFLSIVFALFNYIIMANALFIVWGLIVFIIYLYARNREVKHVIALAIVAIVAIIFILAYHSPNVFPVFIQEIIKSLKIHLEYSSYDIRYFMDFMKYPFGVLMGVFFFSGGMYYAIKRKNNAVVSCGYIYITSACFFYLFTRRIFVMRYMIYSLPFLIVCIIYGMQTMYLFSNKYLRRFLGVLCICGFLSNALFMARTCYVQDDDRAVFSPAYNKIVENINVNQEFPFYSSHFQSFYLQQYKNIKYYEMEDVKGSLYNQFITFYEIMNQYSEGIISMETEKMNLLTSNFKSFLIGWTEQFAGTGVDNYEVELFKYNAIKLSEDRERAQEGWTDIYENIQYKMEDNFLQIRVAGGLWLDEVKFISIKVNDKPYQLIISEDIEEGDFLYGEIDIDSEIATFNDEYGVCLEKGTTDIDGIIRDNYIFIEKGI